MSLIDGNISVFFLLAHAKTLPALAAALRDERADREHKRSVLCGAGEALYTRVLVYTNARMHSGRERDGGDGRDTLETVETVEIRWRRLRRAQNEARCSSGPARHYACM